MSKTGFVISRSRVRFLLPASIDSTGYRRKQIARAGYFILAFGQIFPTLHSDRLFFFSTFRAGAQLRLVSANDCVVDAVAHCEGLTADMH
jgi:hypothetical protein